MNVDRPNSRNQKWLAIARRCMPGGSFNSAYLNEDLDIVIASGRGSKVWDLDGQEYIDCLNGSGPMVVGHAHPDVVAAVREASDCPSNYYVLNERGIRLAERLVNAIPCADQVKFGLSGSDATFFALRLARAFTGRSKVIKFEGGFLGVNDYALMSVNPPGERADPRAIPDSAGIPPVLLHEILVAPFNDLDTTLQLIQKNSESLAAVIIEPQQRCIDPLPGFLEGLRETTRKYGILLIFDEVVTGFRLAYGGAQERYGVIPDLATYGKIIGGGLPLSAVAGRADIMDLTNPRKHTRPDYAYISSTMSGNTTAAAAGLATLDILSKPGTYERLYAIADRFRKGAADAFRHHGVAAQLLGSGPVAQIALTPQRVRDYRSSKTSNKELHGRLIDGILSRGVLTHGKFYFSLAHSDDDIDRVVQVINDTLAEIAH